ncbi:MAG TPA: hypothetical protein PLV41_08835 [Miltoncostaeales bacterium]|jgi:hypothetical protein|nr:hypothetical protein [Miltoncostaeales bacterium]
MSSSTGLLFSYAIGAIFALGGIAFMIFLDERRFLFGVPYLILGTLLLYGVARSQRRRGSEPHDEESPEE